MTSTQGMLGKYEIITEVGRGGFAVVYQARDTTLNRVVALKVLAPHLVWDPTFLARFQREAQTAANLKHPNIVTIYEIAEAQGQHYIAMEFLAGHTLKDLIAAQGALPLPQATRILEQIAGALDYAHDKGVIHRDVKPSNIIVGEGGHATLTDFGLVRAAEGSNLTTGGQILGTPEYMSPEQAEAPEDQPVDWRTDIYSLGVVAYEMLTGRVPFKAERPSAVLYKHVHEAPPPPRKFNPAVSPTIDPVLLKALAKRRQDRYQSGAEMVQTLKEDQHSAKPVERLASAQPRYRRVAIRLGVVLGLAILVIVGLAVLVGGMMTTTTPATPTRIAHTATTVPDATLSPTNTPSQPDLATSEGQDDKEMVLVPAGEFLMGSLAGEEQDDEYPHHIVYLDDFYIDKTEVTNAEFERFVQATGYQTTAEKEGWGWVWTGSQSEQVRGADWQHPQGLTSTIRDKMDHPVVQVSWEDAAAYAQWAGKRLPTEAEWEKAARGTDGRIYPWGKEWDSQRCNSQEGEQATTVPVGSYPTGASPYGCLDLAGNAWEWCADWYDPAYYQVSPSRNPTGPNATTARVFRGGSWYSPPFGVRVAFRLKASPTYRSDTGGFRCCQSHTR